MGDLRKILIILETMIISNVSWDSRKKRWVGSKTWRSIRYKSHAKSKRQAAKELNFLCREVGAPLPNPRLPCVRPSGHGETKCVCGAVLHPKLHKNFCGNCGRSRFQVTSICTTCGQPRRGVRTTRVKNKSVRTICVKNEISIS